MSSKHKVLRVNGAPKDAPPLAVVCLKTTTPVHDEHAKFGCKLEHNVHDKATADAIFDHAKALAVRSAHVAGVPIPQFVETLEQDGVEVKS